MFDSLQPHRLQHTRFSCPSPSLRIHPNLCPLSQWSHPTISSSVTPSTSSPHSFPESGSFLMSQLFASGGQSIGASASASLQWICLPMYIQGWFALGLTDLISLLSTGLLRVFSSIMIWKHQLFGAQQFHWDSFRPTFIFIDPFRMFCEFPIWVELPDKMQEG